MTPSEERLPLVPLSEVRTEPYVPDYDYIKESAHQKNPKGDSDQLCRDLGIDPEYVKASYHLVRQGLRMQVTQDEWKRLRALGMSREQIMNIKKEADIQGTLERAAVIMGMTPELHRQIQEEITQLLGSAEDSSETDV